MDIDMDVKMLWIKVLKYILLFMNFDWLLKFSVH